MINILWKNEEWLLQRFGMEQYVLIFENYVIKVLHHWRSIAPIEKQKEYLSLMWKQFWSLCARTEVVELLDNWRLPYCIIQEKLEKHISDCILQELPIHTLLQIRKYYAIAIIARTKWLWIDVKWFDCTNIKSYSIWNSPKKGILYKIVFSLIHLKSRLAIDKSRNIMLDKENNVKIVDMCYTQQESQLLSGLSRSEWWVTYRNKTDDELLLWDTETTISKSLKHTLKSFITKWLDQWSLLINLFYIECLILRKYLYNQ